MQRMRDRSGRGVKDHEAAGVPRTDVADLPAGTADLDLLGRASVAERASTMAALHAGVGNAAVMRMLDASPRLRGASPAGRAVARRAQPGRAGAAAPDAGPAGADASVAGQELASGEISESATFDADLGIGAGASPAVQPAVPAVFADGAEGSEMLTPEEVPEPELSAAEAAPGEGQTARGDGGQPGGRRPRGGGPKPAQEETVTMPDVVQPELEEIHLNDGISAALPLSATIGGGAPPKSGAFGVTRASTSVTGVTITRGKGTFKVRGMIKLAIKWSVQPIGRTDISGATDGSITAGNYKTVVKDLTPNMSSSGGRPPRTRFWARDLTKRHELFHAGDYRRKGGGAAKATVKWLSSRVADSFASVKKLVKKLPSRFVRTLVAAMGGEKAEIRAYGDGAPVYRSRAKAVKARGAAGKYPK